MTDLIFLGAVAAFFLLTLGYIKFCDSLAKKESDK